MPYNNVLNIQKFSDNKLAFTINEWCYATGLGRSKTYELLSTKQLRAIKCGGRTLIPADEARRFLSALPPLID